MYSRITFISQSTSADCAVSCLTDTTPHPVMATGPVEERNQDATIYVGGLDEKTTDAILWELFLQAGPVVNVHMPKDRITSQHQGYACFFREGLHLPLTYGGPPAN